MGELKNYSNVTDEEYKERVAKLNKQAKCPTCASKRNQASRMGSYMDAISSFVRDANNDLKRGSCILCVEKHLVRAERFATGYKGDDPIVKEETRLKALGELNQAKEESEAYEELHNAIIDIERAYRYNNTIFSVSSLAPLIVKVKENSNAELQ